MKSRMNSYIAGLMQYFTALLFTLIIVLQFASCKSTDEREMQEYVNDTFRLDKTVPENDKVETSVLQDFNDAEFTGTYKLTGDPICSIILVIKKDPEGYSYTFSGAVSGSGRIGLEKKEGRVHVYFNGTRCGTDKDSSSGIYSSKTIEIRNYGNSNSNNLCFRECDSQILRFVKN